MNVQVRTALERDAESIVELVNGAYRVEEFFVRGDRIDREEVLRLQEKGAFLFAEASMDGSAQPLGCIYVEVEAERGYFGLLSVHPQRQGGGVGRRLVDRAEAYCREHGAGRIEILVVNLRRELHPWYRRLGYREVGTAPFDDTDRLLQPCHFVVMAKGL